MLAGLGSKISMQVHYHSGICTRCAGVKEVYISPVATCPNATARGGYMKADCLSVDAADQASLMFSSVEGK